MKLTAPFPYFGGKRRAASAVWSRFGPVDRYVEPFAGSIAVLLSCPYGPRPIEVVNDLDGVICNFWRAVRADPQTTAHYADYPTVHVDLVARRARIQDKLDDLTSRLIDDPEYFDPKMAGWWVWCISNSIGNAGQRNGGQMGMPSIDAKRNAGKGVQRQRKNIDRPHIDDTGGGMGVQRHRKTYQGRHKSNSEEWLTPWFEALSQRLSQTIVTCIDWKGVLSPTLLGITPGQIDSPKTTGVFLDPPYNTPGRNTNIYQKDSLTVANNVETWALSPHPKYGIPAEHPRLRICIAGYEGEYPRLDDWQKVPWKRAGGYENSGSKKKDRQEMLWFSPQVTSPTLF